jgi:class 3 adenylate cyclase/CheY-like chemotaxis protein
MRTRLAAVMFTDLVGSTQLLARIGRESADDVRGRHFGTLREALTAHEGIEVKSLGDGLMASFDSASDGLACAVTMQQAVERDGRRSDHPLRLRIGVSAGDVTCEAGDLFGLAVVEASRLCAACAPGQVFCSGVVGTLVADGDADRLAPIEPLSLRGLPGLLAAYEVRWELPREGPLRVGLADDAVLLRESIARLLESEGFDVVLQVSNAENLSRAVLATRPDVLLLDVRMPPTHTDEGLRAAEVLGRENPDLGLLLLSQDISAGAARRLLGIRTTGVGYLLKERVGDVGELVAAIRSVAAGGTELDPGLAQERAEGFVG